MTKKLRLKDRKNKKRKGKLPWWRDQADKVFSRYIRIRDNYTCQARFHEKCRVRVEPPTDQIQASHFHKRGDYGTRFDPDNCDAFCDICHSALEHRKTNVYYDWKLKQLGPERFEAMRKRSLGIPQFRAHDYEEMIERFNKLTEDVINARVGEVLGAH